MGKQQCSQIHPYFVVIAAAQCATAGDGTLNNKNKSGEDEQHKLQLAYYQQCISETASREESSN